MTISPFDSQILGPLLSDPEVAAAFSDAETVRAMIRVEVALARAEARLGVIPAAAAEAISRAGAGFAADLGAMGASTEKSGVATIALVEQFRQTIGGEAAAWLHWGATSQDIIDTALVIRLAPLLDHVDARLAALVAGLAGLADRHRGTVLAARTRFQQALPTSFGLKAAGWLLPLLRHRRRLEELRPRLLTVQFGGAAGTLAALGGDGAAVMDALADELGLVRATAPWHAQRDGVAELAGWLSLVTGSLGKFGQDMILMAQTEVGEVRESAASGRGGSSTLPQKANPVAGEVLVTAARMNATLVSAVHQGQIQEHERGGPGWQLEWLALPQMLACTGAALRQAGGLVERLEVSAERMAANLASQNGLLLAEAASFALAAHMPRPDAQALVKQACATVMAEGLPLVEVLRGRTDAPVDWVALADPANYLGANDQLIDRVLAEARGGA